MTVTGSDIVRQASALLDIPGIHYGSFDCIHRCLPDQPPHCVDCSGLTSRVQALLLLVADDFCIGSFEQARLCHQANTGLPFSLAVNTPGAFGFQGINEGQGGRPGIDPGHIVVFVGDGIHTLEARGHASGVGMFFASSLRFDYCAMPPNVARVPQGTPPTPTPLPTFVNQENPMGMVPLPATNATPATKVATARAVPNFNFVLLENGGRLIGDTPVDPSGVDRTRHYWLPPVADRIPGWTIIDVADLRTLGKGMAPENAIVVTFADPSGAVQSYKAAIAVPA